MSRTIPPSCIACDARPQIAIANPLPPKRPLDLVHLKSKLVFTLMRKSNACGGSTPLQEMNKGVLMTIEGVNTSVM
jgi:hypothetical protein